MITLTDNLLEKMILSYKANLLIQIIQIITTLLIDFEDYTHSLLHVGSEIILSHFHTRHFPIPIVNFLQIISIHTYVYPKF